MHSLSAAAPAGPAQEAKMVASPLLLLTAAATLVSGVLAADNGAGLTP